jgi:hypothetical protein
VGRENICAINIRYRFCLEREKDGCIRIGSKKTKAVLPNLSNEVGIVNYLIKQKNDRGNNKPYAHTVSGRYIVRTNSANLRDDPERRYGRIDRSPGRKIRLYYSLDTPPVGLVSDALEFNIVM